MKIPKKRDWLVSVAAKLIPVVTFGRFESRWRAKTRAYAISRPREKMSRLTWPTMCRVAKAASCQNGQVFRVTYQAEVYTDTVDGGQIQKYRIKTLLISTVLFLICNPSVFYGGGYISRLWYPDTYFISSASFYREIPIWNMTTFLRSKSCISNVASASICNKKMDFLVGLVKKSFCRKWHYVPL